MTKRQRDQLGQWSHEAWLRARLLVRGVGRSRKRGDTRAIPQREGWNLLEVRSLGEILVVPRCTWKMRPGGEFIKEIVQEKRPLVGEVMTNNSFPVGPTSGDS